MSQFVITFQFVIHYYKLERSCNATACQFVKNYYKMARTCNAIAFQFVIIYCKLERYYELGRSTAVTVVNFDFNFLNERINDDL